MINLGTVGESEPLVGDMGADEIGHPEERFSSEKQQCLMTNVVCEGEKELSRIFNLENSGRWKEDNEFVLRDVLGAPSGLA